MDKLAVILPSRGLLFSETFEELLRELEGFNYEIYFSHERPLPTCFNEPTEKALADPAVFAVLICEDDMILPEGILKKMFSMHYPVVAMDYPFKQNGDSTMLHDPKGMAYYSGTGFMLIARAVLEKMEKPIWRTDRTFDLFIATDTIHWWPRKLDRVFYGLHDLNFGMTLYSSGMPIKPVDQTGGQRKLIQLGKKHTNNGAHKIQELTEVGRDIVSGQVDPENSELFLGAMNRVRNVQMWTEKPPWISYTASNQPYPNDGRKYSLVK